MGSCLTCAGATLAISASVASASTAGSLPIREVTVFKDGHAMVLREGAMPTNEQGDVVLNELPQPVLGTFWAYEEEPEAALRSVRGSRSEVDLERRPETIAELIEASVGRKIIWRVSEDESREATIAGLLVSEPVAPQNQAPNIHYNNFGRPYSVPVNVNKPASKAVLLRFDDGATLVQPIEHMREVTFVDAPDLGALISDRVEAERLTVDLEWEGAPEPTAEVGVMYVQRGLRWIPGYRVTMLDKGRARVELQATLINELDDLDDVRCNLVIGVPRFEFEHTLDPIALSQVIASLGPYFETASQTGSAFSNALMSQSRRMSEYAGDGGAAPPAVEVSSSERAEDLYVFGIEHVTLRRGERLVIPIHAYETSFEAVYKLDLPIQPPMGARRNFNTEQQRKLAELMSRPKAMHVLRLTNESEHPITTAPALIVQENGMPLAQGMLTYTSPGASVDLEVTAAVDIQVECASEETANRSETKTFDRKSYYRIDLRDECVITNWKSAPVRVEVRAYTLGWVDNVSGDGESTAINIYAESSMYAMQTGATAWWQFWSWPWWWVHLNSAARIEWDLELDPGESIELEWQHHYYWRI